MKESFPDGLSSSCMSFQGPKGYPPVESFSKNSVGCSATDWRCYSSATTITGMPAIEDAKLGWWMLAGQTEGGGNLTDDRHNIVTSPDFYV